MADYRRLISYIYEYEGKQKGKNVGFAKLEARNGQCRINVNVKRIYMGGNAIGVYLLGTGGRETFLGNVFVRGGNGEFRANVDAKNVEGTGTGLDTYFGLSVHDVKNSWRCYKTIWEDALAAEEGNTAENPVLSVPKFTAEMLPEAEREMTPQAVSKVVKEIEAEIAKEEERREQEEKTAHAAELREEAQETEEASPAQGETAAQDNAEQDENQKQEENSDEHGMVYLSEETEEIDRAKIGQTEECTDRAETAEQQEEPRQDSMQPIQNTKQNSVSVHPVKKNNESYAQPQMPWTARPPFLMRTPQRVQRAPVPQLQQNSAQQSLMSQPASSAEVQTQTTTSASAVPRPVQPQNSQAARANAAPAPMVSPELENPEVLRYLQETEDLAADPEKLWEELKKSYPKIQPFEYEDGCDILTIRPQDIGKLPRECWIHGNNSFLLHGYYNFRYLILVKLGGNKKKARYLLGVPGHYYSSEKYMATMFGFPNFVLSRRQPVGDGRFGYWYTDLKIR